MPHGILPHPPSAWFKQPFLKLNMAMEPEPPDISKPLANVDTRLQTGFPASQAQLLVAIDGCELQVHRESYIYIVIYINIYINIEN